MKANDFIKGLKALTDHKYLYGTYGQVVTSELITQKTNQYPNIYNKTYIAYAKNLIGKKACDCSGMIKKVLFDYYNAGKYMPEYDLSSTGFLNKCVTRNVIYNNTQFNDGDLLYMAGTAKTGFISHVGIFIGEGLCIQSAWGVGVFISKLSETKWEYKGELPMIEKNIKPHWAQKFYDDLVKKGVILGDDTSAIWRNFDTKLSTITVGQLLAILSKNK